MIRDTTQIPVHDVPGNIRISGKRICRSEVTPDGLRAALTNSSFAYDGHMWIAVSGGIGDIALFCSAYAQPEDHWFRIMITD